MFRRRATLALLLLLPGLAAVAAFGGIALLDWRQLQLDYRHYQTVAASGADLRTLFAAWAAQDIHRTNLFADGVWTLLGALLAGLGVHGWCLLPRDS